MSEANLAYIAGFFDGEGTICVHRNQNRFYIQISIGNCDLEILQFVQSVFGGSIVTDARTLNNRYRKPFHTWTRACVSAVNVLNRLLPYLRHTKQQALLAIELQKLIINERKQFGTIHKLSKERFDVRMEYKRKISTLNIKMRRK